MRGLASFRSAGSKLVRNQYFHACMLDQPRVHTHIRHSCLGCMGEACMPWTCPRHCSAARLSTFPQVSNIAAFDCVGGWIGARGLRTALQLLPPPPNLNQAALTTTTAHAQSTQRRRHLSGPVQTGPDILSRPILITDIRDACLSFDVPTAAGLEHVHVWLLCLARAYVHVCSHLFEPVDRTNTRDLESMSSWSSITNNDR